MRDIYRLFTPWRVRWYSRGALAALAIALIATIFTGAGDKVLTGRLGGDFQMFYNAGRMVAGGAGDELYSLSKQRDYQAGVVGTNGRVAPFVYPPVFALAYVPLSKLPYRVAYLLHTIAMAAALAAACVLIKRMYPEVVPTAYWLFFGVLMSHPFLRSVFGGQNTALSLLLVTLCWYSVVNHRQVGAGVFLGLLFYKPQFALPLAGLFFISGRWRVWASALAVSLTLLAAATAVVGAGWIVAWIDLVNLVFIHAMTGNVPYIVSWLGLSHAIFGLGSSATIIGWAVTVATVIALSWAWFAGGRRADFGAQIALASVAIVLLAPQTQFYDTGLALVAVVVVAAQAGRFNPFYMALLWAASYLQLASPWFGVSLSFIPLLAIFLVAFWLLWQPATKEDVRS